MEVISLSRNYEHEIELMAEYSYDESDGDLRILFKHDYYSSDNALGRKLLNSFINNLIVESDRLCLIIVTDSAVKLIESNSDFMNLLSLSPSTIICNDSLSFYGIDCKFDEKTVLLDSDDIVDTILNSSPNIIVE